MLAFSTVAVDGLTQLGTHPDDKDFEDYFHTWKVIGHFLGIHTDFMPTSIKDAGLMWLRLDQRNFGTTPSAVQITDSHVKFLEKLVPGEAIDNIVPSLMTYMLGFRYAHWLEVGRVGWTVILISILKWILSIKEVFTHLSWGTESLYRKWSINLMENLEADWMKGTGDAPPFRIPSESAMGKVPGRPDATITPELENDHPELSHAE